MLLFRAYRVLFFAGLALCGIGPAHAGIIDIGSANSQNAMPFEDVTSGIYQQIYSGSDFGSSPVSLTGVTFFGQTGATITGANYTIDVSTTNAALGYSALYQLGTNDTQEFNGVLSGPVVGGSFTIPFSQVFNYNPSSGNLLLQISIAGGPSNPGGLGLSSVSNGGSLFSRSYNVFSGPININAADSTGLVTQFNTATTPVDEPESLLLMGSGLIGGAILMRRRMRLAVRHSY